jgi:hypothetical protein
VHKIEKVFINILVSSIFLSFLYFLIVIPSKEIINKYSTHFVNNEINNQQEAKKERKQPQTPVNNYQESSEVSYKDWTVDKLDNLVMYATHGSAVHGHKFGWVKKAGNCSEDILYLTFSTTHEEKNILDKLKHNRLPIKVSFPEVDGVSHVMMAELLSASDFASMKIVTLSNVLKDPVFDLYMDRLHQIEIEIDSPYKYVFDIPVDYWSLDGYIAAKVKAEEMCKGMIKEDKLI